MSAAPRYADLRAVMCELLAPDVAIDEPDLSDDWLEACKNAGLPASRYQSVPPRQLLRDMEALGEAVREVYRGVNGTGLPVSRWGGRGYVPRTQAAAVRVEPRPSLTTKRARKAAESQVKNVGTERAKPPAGVSLACLRQELAQVRGQLQRLESQLSVLEGRA